MREWEIDGKTDVGEYASTNRVQKGKFEYNSRTSQGLVKATCILQFSKTKSLRKILIQLLKFFFKNARLR